MQWFRMYVEAIDDEKLALLAFEDRWHYVAVLCMKRKGMLDLDEPAALRDRKVGAKLGLGERARDEVRVRLCEVNLIDMHWHPVGWDRRQYVSDADSTAAQRKRKQRAKQRHGPVTRDISEVTGESRAGHASQSQIQSTESDKNVRASSESLSSTRQSSSFDSGAARSDLKIVNPERNGARLRALAKTLAHSKAVPK